MTDQLSRDVERGSHIGSGPSVHPSWDGADDLWRWKLRGSLGLFECFARSQAIRSIGSASTSVRSAGTWSRNRVPERMLRKGRYVRHRLQVSRLFLQWFCHDSFVVILHFVDRLPFMKVEEVPYCSNSSSVRLTEQLSDELITGDKFLCNCLPSCTKVIWYFIIIFFFNLSMLSVLFLLLKIFSLHILTYRDSSMIQISIPFDSH